MKIVSYNIQFGLGKDGCFDLKRIAGEVDGADVIALQEVERHWPRSGDVDQAAQLGELLNQYYWVYGPYFDVDASTAEVDGSIKNRRRQFGNMVLSKTPILSTRLFPLPKLDLGPVHNMVVGVLEAVVTSPQGDALRIYNTHLSATSQRERVEQILSLRDIIRRVPSEGGAWSGSHASPLWQEEGAALPFPEAFVLLGDFNHEAKDHEHEHLTGPRDANFKRISREQDLLDTWVAAGHDENDGVSYPEPAAAGMRIDYIFIDGKMRRRVLGAWIDETAQGSDHQPCWVELDY